MSDIIDSLNRAGAATAAARIAELEAENARLRALVDLAREVVADVESAGQLFDRYNQADGTCCPLCDGVAMLSGVLHTADCALGRFLREAGEVG